GLSSYLLIGFWYQRHSAVVAARKAFVMNVIGDVGMILGTFVLFTQFQQVTYAGVFQRVSGCPPSSIFVGCFPSVHTGPDSFAIERALAYSTISQIGTMFLAVGIGGSSAGFFHLLSPAFFTALLFLAAGNVIHAMHDEQDMRKYGGLWGQMRPTSITFLIGSLS